MNIDSVCETEKILLWTKEVKVNKLIIAVIQPTNFLLIDFLPVIILPWAPWQKIFNSQQDTSF